MGLHKKTAFEIKESIKNKEIKAVEVVESLLKHIEKTEKDIKAFVRLTPDIAMDQAKKVDEKIAKGEELGDLAGVPMALKDNICTQGVVTSCSSKMLENFIPSYSATVNEKLGQAEAVLLGKSNMDEFAMGSTTETSAFHMTKNPWDLNKVPGGSSGGSAAMVSADQAYFALGTDTGGSVRQPAAFCGVVGLKPTYGLVSRYGVVAFASSLDQVGTLTKDVKDSALVLNTLAGHDKKDATSAGVKKVDYLDGIEKGIKGLKIGIPKEFFGQGLSTSVEKALNEAIYTLKQLGAECENISLPYSEYALPAYYIISSAEASSNLARFDGIRYGYRPEDFDNLEDLYKKARSQGFGSEVKRRIMLGTHALSSGHYDAYYKKAMKVRTLIKEDFDKAFKKYDILVSPTNPSTAFNIGAKIEDPLEIYLTDIYTVPLNIAGLPGISIPAGFSEGNLPIGLQMIGNVFEEKTLLQAAYAFEQGTDFHKKRPTFGKLVK